VKLTRELKQNFATIPGFNGKICTHWSL